VLIADLERGTLELDGATEVHCELPPGVAITRAADGIAERLRAAETRIRP
jgi:hypothetical protein